MQRSSALPQTDRQVEKNLRPPISLQRKVAVWTIVLVIVPTLVYAAWISHITTDTMRSYHRNNILMLGQTLAASLANRISADRNGLGEVFGTLELNPRLSFVMVQTPNGDMIDYRCTDDDARYRYEHWQWRPGQTGTIEIGDDLFVCKVPIWNPPIRTATVKRAADQPRHNLEGFVVVALHEVGLASTLNRMHINLLVAAAAVCLVSLPFVFWAVRRWTNPLRSVLKATVQLGKGHVPAPIVVETRDELWILADAFNEMAVNLWSTRQQLQVANENLEQKVKSRTTELERVNRQLELEIKDRNEFLRAVTHDMSAPLRNINGMATMLLMKHQEELTDDAAKKLQRINANVRAQTDLINDLFELSRLRKRPKQEEPVDCHELVRQLRDSLDYDLEQAQIEFIIEGRLPIVMAEHNRLRQVFQNLVDNAVKYMMDSPVRRITVRHQLEPDKVQFSVTDTGIGIDKKDLPHVFTVFRRAVRGTARQVSGRGVGLASVKTIVELYGGDIWAKSKPDQGSIFHFTIDRQLVRPHLPARAAV